MTPTYSLLLDGKANVKGKGERDPWDIVLTSPPPGERPAYRMKLRWTPRDRGPLSSRCTGIPVGDAVGPAGVLGTTVKTHLKEKFKTQSPIDSCWPDQPSYRTITGFGLKTA